MVPIHSLFPAPLVADRHEGVDLFGIRDHEQGVIVGRLRAVLARLRATVANISGPPWTQIPKQRLIRGL